MSVLSAESRRDYEIHSYPVLIYALVPIGALVLQAWLPDQSASVTDPLLALAVGLAFRSLYRTQPRAFARDSIFQRARNR